ncbi:RusA family crossover junction endodeoxyribonuclease [Hydrogenophaga crocea]|uniref:RusA family crossover junction endodeoxyribonuclease n=1 Tax=Hydrogenophaga crocea TaxID=2716225 RepID=A0A6G8IC72_9BURK|nr:RusA family crossover junction endodeoxyribonuclease [Hydrogenophaga crocea]
MDAGTGLLWEDDSQIVELTLRKDYDKTNPRIELIVLPVGAEPG